MRSGSRPSPKGTMLLFLFAGGAVSPVMCPPDQQNDKKRRDGRKARQEEGTDREPKQTVDRNEVAGLFACSFRVIRRGMIHIAIYRDIISHTMRYHKIKCIEISYPYPEN